MKEEKNIENININELVKVETLPKIYSQLDTINELIIEKTKNIDDTLNDLSKLSIQEQEKNKQDIKKYKTYLNSFKNQLEDKRKEIKKEINKPYDDFNSYYENKVKVLLDNAINKLNNKISEIENNQIANKTNELKIFFNNYKEFYHIESIINFEDLPIKINLSNSLDSLKKDIKSFCEKISNDLVVISGYENKEEILLEYQNNSFDLSKAFVNIQEKNKRLEELKKQTEQLQKQFKEEEKVIENINTLCSVPIEIEDEDEEEIFEVVFTCKSTKSKFLKLKQFLKDNEIEYF